MSRSECLSQFLEPNSTSSAGKVATSAPLRSLTKVRSMPMVSNRFTTLAAMLFATVGSAFADTFSSTVTVEFLEGQTKVTPAEPTINLAASPSVVLELLPGGGNFKVTPVLAVETLRREAKQQQARIPKQKYPNVYNSLTVLAESPTTEN